MTSLDKKIDSRRTELTADRIDMDNLEDRLDYEADLYRMKLTTLIREYRRGIVKEYEGWQWRALNHVVIDRTQRLERKDHTRLK